MKLTHVLSIATIAATLTTATIAQQTTFSSSSRIQMSGSMSVTSSSSGGTSYRTLFELEICLSEEQAADAGWNFVGSSHGVSSRHGDFVSKRFELEEDDRYRLSQQLYMVGESVIHCDEQVSVESYAAITSR